MFTGSRRGTGLDMLQCLGEGGVEGGREGGKQGGGRENERTNPYYIMIRAHKPFL